MGKPASDQVTPSCGECRMFIVETGFCNGCHEAEIIKAVEETEDAAAVALDDGEVSADAVREYARDKFLMGKIDKATRDAMDDCARDMEGR